MQNNSLTAEYIQQLTHQTDPLLTEMEQFARENRVPILDLHSAKVLETLLALKNNRDVLEVGTAIGYSSIRIARMLKDGATLLTLEKSKPSYELSQNYIAKAGVQDKVEVLFGEAIESVKQLQVRRFGFIFLDADKKDYTPLLEPLLALLEPGGIFLVDNLLWHGYTVMPDEEIPEAWRNSTRLVREFNQLFFNHPQLKSMLLPVGDGLGVGIKQ